MTARVHVVVSQPLDAAARAPNYNLTIQLNLVIERSLSRVLTPAQVNQRVMTSIGYAEIDWDPAARPAREPAFPHLARVPRGHYRLQVQAAARIGDADTVTTHDTYVRADTGGGSRCEQVRVHGGMTTDEVVLVPLSRTQPTASLEHELGHALGCRHTDTEASVMCNASTRGGSRGRHLGVSDILCILHQLDLRSRNEQIIDSSYIQHGRPTGASTWESGDQGQPINGIYPNVTADRGMAQTYDRSRVAPPADHPPADA